MSLIPLIKNRIRNMKIIKIINNRKKVRGIKKKTRRKRKRGRRIKINNRIKSKTIKTN